jgi:hypothetical protein
MVDGSSAAELGDGVRGWLVFYALATAGAVAIMLANPAAGWPSTLTAVALVLGTQAVYLLLARPGRSGIRSNGRRGRIFAVIAMAAFGAAVFSTRGARCRCSRSPPRCSCCSPSAGRPRSSPC